VSIVIRPAEMSDEDALTRIEQETPSLEVSPNVFPPRPFFKDARPEEVLVSRCSTTSLRFRPPAAGHAVGLERTRVYQRHGYETEGELRGEFRLPVGPGGAVVQVDDMLLAKTIEPVPRQTCEAAPTDP
jgi:hypothetical protein